MRAEKTGLIKFLGNASQFIIPVYQRTYSWKEGECRQLWTDIVRAGNEDAIAAHFVGSVVYIEKDLHLVTLSEPLLVIDGQQRLTTVTLLLAALAEALGDTEPIDGFSTHKLRNKYLLNPEETGERHYKLLLSQNDKESLKSIVGKHEKPAEPSRNVMDNHALFEKWITELQGDFSALCKGLAKLSVIDIGLDREHDNPQLIFESMNSTGRELSQADLIRNFILMELEPDVQEDLYKRFLLRMEVSFGQKAYETHFDRFMRYYLIVKTREIPRLKDVYEAFKKYAQSTEVIEAGIEALLQDIWKFSEYYCAMALGTEPDMLLKTAFHDLQELKVDVTYPLLLELYHDYATKSLAKEDFLEAVRLVETYIFRRAICNIATKSLNKTFVDFAKTLKKDQYMESIRARFLLLPSYRRFPGDDEFQRDIQTRDLYNFRSRSYCLRRFENYNRKETLSVNEYTIEHIMPQTLPPEWKKNLGEDWNRVHQSYVHTLGNLTLTGYNSEYSNQSFLKKRDMEGGFKQSPLRVNAGLGELDAWNEDSIKSRAERLASQATQIWPAPKVQRDALSAYQPQTPETVDYSIKDHPYLLDGSMSEIFEAFRHEVQKLNPCVSEEFLKHYVAYKAETNFVDLVPGEKQLKLSFNMDFPEISDPRGMCRNISDIGSLGNGNIEVKLCALDELPYVLGLVRQSLERQLEN